VSVDAGPFRLEAQGSLGGTDVPAALCIHGLTGTPYEVRPVAEALAEQGFTCVGPVLPGHCDSPEALNRIPYQEWVSAVLGVFDELAASHRRVYVVGLSLGGLLSLRLAAERPVAGGVVLAAPLRLGRVTERLVPWLAPWLASVPKTPDIRDDAARARHPGYDRMPLGSVAELILLQRDLVGRLANITAPLRLVYSREDRTVRVEDAERLREALVAADADVQYLENSGHVLPVDLERDRVASLAVDFLCKLNRERA